MLDRTEDLLKIENLSKSFSISAGLFAKPFQLRALQDINFTVKRGETLGNYQEVRIRHFNRTIDKYLAS